MSYLYWALFRNLAYYLLPLEFECVSSVTVQMSEYLVSLLLKEMLAPLVYYEPKAIFESLLDSILKG